MNKLEDTWVIIAIGKREYAINQSYIKAFTDLSRCTFVKEAQGRFLRGTYTIFGSNIVVIDGHKIAREPSQIDRRLNFCKHLSDIKLKCISWLDTLDWIAMTGENDKKFYKLLEEIIGELGSTRFPHDKYMDKLIVKASEHMNICASRAHSVVEARTNKKMTITEADAQTNAVRREVERYVLDNLDNIAEYNTNQITSMCIVIQVGDKTFGMTIDSVKSIAEQDVQVSRNKRTVLSAGVATVDNVKYNIMDLTKVGGLVY